MNISKAKQQELKEIDGAIEDARELAERLRALVNAQPDLAEVSGEYDMRTDVGVLTKTLDRLTATLYFFALENDFMGWKHIK